MRHLFGTCDEVEFDFGQGDRCFDVVRAQSYADRYREAYAKDSNSLGPNVRANYEMSVNMTLADIPGRTLSRRAFSGASRQSSTSTTSCYRRLRRCPRSLDAALSRGARRNAAAQLRVGSTSTLCASVCRRPVAFAAIAIWDAAEAMEQAFANIPGLDDHAPTWASLPSLRSTSNRLQHSHRCTRRLRCGSSASYHATFRWTLAR